MPRFHSKTDRLNGELRNQQMLDSLGSGSNADADRIRRRKISNRMYHRCTVCNHPIEPSRAGLCTVCRSKIMG